MNQPIAYHCCVVKTGFSVGPAQRHLSGFFFFFLSMYVNKYIKTLNGHIKYVQINTETERICSAVIVVSVTRKPQENMMPEEGSERQ